jgi:hypothetical protein
LQHRYTILVQQHARAAGTLNAGPAALLDDASAFAATQAAWRFWHNDRVTLPLLVEPLQQVVRHWRTRKASAWALVLHDWSALSYPTHTGKKDRKGHGSAFSKGYDLSTALVVDGFSGDPVAPIELELRTAQAIYSTRVAPPAAEDTRLDNIRPAMQASAALGLGERVIHVIDREADSLAHYRDWQADGHIFLVRADSARKVRWQGQEWSLAELAGRLEFRRCREVAYHGQNAVQHVAATEVVLDRPAWRKRHRGGRVVNERVPGPPLSLRLIVSRVCDGRGQTVAVWYLLNNAPAAVTDETLALWYYWRWRIESLYKLLKSAGQQVEQWQQESGEAIAKRLLVAAMACVVVWQLQRATASEALSFRDFLVRLSGRQMKRGQSHTAPALLSGLWVYLSMLDALQQYSPEQLQAMKAHLDLTKIDTG